MNLRRLIASILAFAAVCALSGAAAAQPDAAARTGDDAVLRTNFADPFVLAVGGRYLAYATNMYGDRSNVPVAFSSDLVTWNLMAVPGNPDAYHDAMPTLPAWAERGRTWAPEVMRIGNRYVLYFTARHRRYRQQCIGAATAADPRGPFVPQGAEPLVCQRALGGTIDASPFRDADGKLYLYFKNDGNDESARTATQLWGQAMAPDGLSLTGEPVALGRNDTPWEGAIVEAPFMVRHGSAYILFYSANDYAWQPRQRLSRYSTGVARCTGPLGPCTEAEGNPILASRETPDCLSGPGHPAIFEANGRHYIAFHAWATRRGCRPGASERYLHVLPLDWNGDTPVVGRAPR